MNQPKLPVFSAKAKPGPVQFQGRPAGPIKALHCAPSFLPDYLMAEELAKKLAPHGVDVVVHMVQKLENRPSPLLNGVVDSDTLSDVNKDAMRMYHARLSVSPGTQDVLPYVTPELLTSPTESMSMMPEAQKQRQADLLEFIAGMRTTFLGKQPEPFTSRWLQDNLHLGGDAVRINKPGVNTMWPQMPQQAFDSIAALMGKPLKIHEKDVVDYGNITRDIPLPDGTRRHLVGDSILEPSRKFLIDSMVLDKRDPDLDKWAIRHLAQELGVKAEEICVIPEANFHHDMVLVPLTYPDILVQSPELSMEVLQKAIDSLKARASRTHEQERELDRLVDMKHDTAFHQKYMLRHGYEPIENVVAALKAHGFNPIPAPLVYGHLDVGYRPGKVVETFNGTVPKEVIFHDPQKTSDCVNMANAHVHAKEDGSLVYVAMASSSFTLNRFASDAIQKCLPSGSAVVTVTGGPGRKGFDGDPPKTRLEEELNKGLGAFHCTFAEEMQPSFYATA